MKNRWKVLEMSWVLPVLLLFGFQPWSPSTELQGRQEKEASADQQGETEEEEEEHEWVEVLEVDLAAVEDYRIRFIEDRAEMLEGLPDWPLKGPDGSSASLYEALEQAAGENRVVWIFVYASWCKNSKYFAPTLAEVAGKYADQGVGLIAVSEYSALAEAQSFLEDFGIEAKLFTQTLNKEDEDRFLTPFFALRRSLGDERKWGTPTHIFVRGYDWRNVHYALGELTADQLSDVLDRLLAAAD